MYGSMAPRINEVRCGSLGVYNRLAGRAKPREKGRDSSLIWRNILSFFRATDTGTILLGPGDVYTILASSAETHGDYIALEAVVPADGGPPLHIHHN